MYGRKKDLLIFNHKNRVGRMFHIGNTISVVNFQGRPKWLAGVLEEQLGPLTFRVLLEDDRL